MSRSWWRRWRRRWRWPAFKSSSEGWTPLVIDAALRVDGTWRVSRSVARQDNFTQYDNNHTKGTHAKH